MRVPHLSAQYFFLLLLQSKQQRSTAYTTYSRKKPSKIMGENLVFEDFSTWFGLSVLVSETPWPPKLQVKKRTTREMRKHKCTTKGSEGQPSSLNLQSFECSMYLLYRHCAFWWLWHFWFIWKAALGHFSPTAQLLVLTLWCHTPLKWSTASQRCTYAWRLEKRSKSTWLENCKVYAVGVGGIRIKNRI